VRAESGLTVMFPSGVSIRADAGVDGLGQPGFEAWSGGVVIFTPFQ
jgi:hypothetical protein